MVHELLLILGGLLAVVPIPGVMTPPEQPSEPLAVRPVLASGLHDPVGEELRLAVRPTWVVPLAGGLLELVVASVVALAVYYDSIERLPGPLAGLGVALLTGRWVLLAGRCRSCRPAMRDGMWPGLGADASG